MKIRSGSGRASGGPLREMAAMASLAGLSLATSGCSFLFVKPPRPPDSGTYSRCTSSNWAPVLDSLVTTVQAVRITLDLVEPDSAFQNAVLNRGSDLAIGVALGTVFVSSAAYGFVEVTRCREGPKREPSPAADESEPEASGPRTPGTASAPPPPGDAGAPGSPLAFDVATARAGLLTALSIASVECKATGTRVVNLTYLRGGSVGELAFEPPFEGGAVGACVERFVRRATLPSFDGDEVRVRKRFDFDAARATAPADAGAR
ncbi:MAG: hypothetical protein JOZ69_10625 [Myxococcales bacterium]|nr:hypothetical protein [Myxococcales bacterium]